jgi:outer membrane autotransporter protein
MWYVDFMASYSWIDHEFTGRTGVNNELGESDKYNSSAIVAQVLPGLKFAIGETAGIYPYVGLRWTYWDTESHTTDVAIPAWRKTYDSFDENWLKAIAGVDADKRWKAASNSTMRLYGGARIEQTLNNDEVEVAQSLQGIRAIGKQDISETSILGNLGLQYLRGNISLTLDLTGEHNSDYDAYSGFLRFGYKF